MQAIRRIRDFRQYGLDLVTGRACPYGMRYLFRLTEDGAQHVREFLGLNVATRASDTIVDLAKTAQEQKLVTVMLSRETLKSLGIYLMFDVHQCVAVVITPTGELLGCETAVEVETARSENGTPERPCGVRWRKASLKDRGSPNDGLAAA
ncbi:MAG: hypothetical protein LJE97_06085 [Betaproteobacteria bacterium]|jgi:hypothetical protein|nr:hypothetical protein [Betaproteobacteria bacterium]